MKDFLIIILAFTILSCGRNFKNENCLCNYSVYIPGNIGITKEEVAAAVSSVLKQSQASRNSIELIIIKYSSGKEVFSYLENSPDEMKIKTYSGNINALVKIKQDHSLQKVVFLKADGKGKEEILRGLVKEIQRAVCDYTN